MSKLNRRILRLAVPNFFASISVPLIGIADTAMVGHLPTVAYMGAVATASVIFDVLFWSMGFLRMGTTSLVAQYYGAGDRRACIVTLYRSLAFALALAALMLAARDLIAWIGFRLAAGSPDVQLWGQRYFEVRICAMPLVLAVFALNGFFLGMANALAPMYITLVANLVNVGADYALIFGKWGAPELGVMGAAWAAVLGNWAAALTGLGILLWKYGDYLREPVGHFFERRQFLLVLRTNLTLFLRTLCLLLAQFSMLAIASRLGEVQLAANAIVWQLWALVSSGVDGFAHAAETLVGNHLGDRNFEATRLFARRLIIWGVGIGAGFSLFYALGLEHLARAFTNHVEVIEVVLSLTFVIALVQPLNAVDYIFDGIFIGANDLDYMLKATAIAAFGFFGPALMVFVAWLDLGLLGAWLAYNALMVGRFLALLPRYRGNAWLKTITDK